MSGPGRVCSIHNEWCPDGGCRWCEPLTEDVLAGMPQYEIALDVWRSEAFRIVPASTINFSVEAMDKIASAE